MHLFSGMQLMVELEGYISTISQDYAHISYDKLQRDESFIISF